MKRIPWALPAWLLLAAAMPAHACADYGRAPSSRWQILAERGINWLVTPCGERIFSMGINVLDSEVPKAALPGKLRYDWRRFYPTEAAWTEDTRRRVRQWGFNTAGAWSAPPERLGLPVIPNLELGRRAGFHWFDPFAPETERRMRAEAAEYVAPYKGKPWRIGYFTDNEVGWWNGALFFFYSAQPASNHTKRRWVESLREIYGGDWPRFSADFVLPPGIGDWDALLASEKFIRLRPGSHGIGAVRRWTAILAEHYYAMVERVLREADPEALIFGDRLPIYYDPVAVRAMARHVDVIAVNYNIDSPDGWIAPYFFDGLRRLGGGKPILVSEWFFAAAENRTGNRNNGHLMTVPTQAARARGAAAATMNFARIPELIGAHWFQFADHPHGGRGDGEDYDFGLVDIANRPYEDLIRALAAANRVAPALHDDAVPAAPAPQGELAVPEAEIDLADHSLADWPKPAALLPPLAPSPGDVAFGEAYLAWNPRGISLATIGQDYYDVDLLDFDGAFPLGEAYRLAVGIDAGAGPRRFTLYFIPPRTKVTDHPPMTALLCRDEAATADECQRVEGAAASYFGADQPRITAELFLPWSALGVEPLAEGSLIRIEIAAAAWHRSRFMSLSGSSESGLPPETALARPENWRMARLGPSLQKNPASVGGRMRDKETSYMQSAETQSAETARGERPGGGSVPR